MNLILVRKKEEQPQDQEQQQEEEEEQIDFKRIIVNQVNINEEKQIKNNGMDAERIKLPREELKEEDQDLKEMFIIKLENLTHSSILQIESREKLHKAKFDNQLKESANRNWIYTRRKLTPFQRFVTKYMLWGEQLVSS